MFEVVVIVADGEHGMATGGEGGEQFAVKHAAEGGVLVGGPFVEQQDVAGFGQGQHEGHAFALALGELGVEDAFAFEREFVGEPQAFAPVLDEGVVHGGAVAGEQLFEQVEVGEYGSEQVL